jgi:hypothetical protein
MTARRAFSTGIDHGLPPTRLKGTDREILFLIGYGMFSWRVA